MRITSALFLAGLLVVTVAGCTATSPTKPPSMSPSRSASPSASPVPTRPAGPELVPGGTAKQNLAFFNAVNSALLAGTPMPGGRAIIDSLVAAGFSRGDMEVTKDTTSIGGAVDQLEFSVRFGDNCLLGEAAASGYTGAVGPALVSGHCLIGQSRPIDW